MSWESFFDTGYVYAIEAIDESRADSLLLKIGWSVNPRRPSALVANGRMKTKPFVKSWPLANRETERLLHAVFEDYLSSQKGKWFVFPRAAEDFVRQFINLNNQGAAFLLFNSLAPEHYRDFTRSSPLEAWRARVRFMVTLSEKDRIDDVFFRIRMGVSRAQGLQEEIYRFLVEHEIARVLQIAETGRLTRPLAPRLHPGSEEDQT